jgi:hypothetical protein
VIKNKTFKKRLKLIIFMSQDNRIKIEAVCTGNTFRSKVFEILGNLVLLEDGVVDKYVVISSGTEVDILNESGIPKLNFQTKRRLIEHELDYDHGIITNDDRRRLIDSLSLDDVEEQYQGNVFKTTFDNYFETILTRYQQMEKEFRGYILKDKRIEMFLDPTPKQTVTRDDVFAIFPMEDKHLNFVRNLYHTQKSEDVPQIIRKPSEYVLGEFDKGLPKAFGTNLETYQNLFNRLEIIARCATRKAVAEHQYHLWLNRLD